MLVHPHPPVSSFSPSAPQSTCCCLLLLASTGLSHRLIASVVGMTCRGATQQESATAARSKTRLLRPSSSVLRHLLEGTLARARPCLTSKRPRHASTGFKVGSVPMCAQRRSVDCRPHGRSRRAWWGCRLDPPGATAKQHGSRPLQAGPLGSMLVHPRPPSHPPRLRAPAAACSSWHPPASRAGSWPAPSV